MSQKQYFPYGGPIGPFGRTSGVPEGNKLDSRQNVRYDENEMVSEKSNSVRILIPLGTKMFDVKVKVI